MRSRETLNIGNNTSHVADENGNASPQVETCMNADSKRPVEV